jgi:uncharacterized membrane protein
MRFLQPSWLVALLPALAVVLVVARHGRRSVPMRQHRVAVGLRVVGVALLVVALAQPVLVRSSSRRSVLFLLDRSSSITAGARTAQEDFVTAALAAAGPEDVAGVAVFGKELRMDSALSEQLQFDGVRTVVDATATDLSSALLAGAAVLPTEGSRRIIVLTDAVETIGNARATATELADQGIAVDVFTLETGRSSDALVARVDAPPTARQGDVVPVKVAIDATVAGSAVLQIDAGGQIQEIPVELTPGRTTVTVEVPAGERGVLQVDATLAAGFDQVPENDNGQALVQIIGQAVVAVVEGRAGEGAEVARALESTGIGTETLPAIPGPDELLGYDGLVLVNVPAPSDRLAADVAAFVEDLGRGLVVIGGDQSFGLGGYQDTDFESVLPVRSNPDDLIRRQPVAEVLLIDTSGSMADCHCGGGEHDASEQGGVNKTDISRAGAGLAIQALQPTDRVGILAFTSGTRWALPLGTVPDAATVSDALDSLTPIGDTEISPALREAIAALADVPEEIRHIVLFTDGWGEDPAVLTAAQEAADAGITLSVLGTGEGTGETLRRMAALGGGRYYPGQDLDAIPEIFVEETLMVARPLIAEGSFLPAKGASSPVTAGLTAAPPLRGYVLTTPKETAQIPLEVGPGDPLFATWQRGLGRATAWTSDATARWSSDWVTWAGYADFWGKVVRDVLPGGRDTPPEVRLNGGSIDISYTAEAPLDAVAIADVRDGEGNVTSVPLQRIDETTFAGTVPVTSSGAYWVAVRVESGGGIVASGSSGVTAGYADEFAFGNPDPALASDLAGASGGRVDPVAAEAFLPAPARGSAEAALWPLLVAIALGLFLIDVALRRLVVGRSDFEVWREQLTTRKRPVAAIETPGAPSAPGTESDKPAREMLPEEETLSRLLGRKRK